MRSPIAVAAQLTVGRLFDKSVRLKPNSVAIQEGPETWTYQQLADRVNCLASALVERGLAAEDRVAILAENRHEYLELQLAAAKVGMSVPCLNWRLTESELGYCIDLTQPRLLLCSPRFTDLLSRVEHDVEDVVMLGEEYEALLEAASIATPAVDVDPEQPLVILYTSGTTGLPKGAVISHRAFIARAMLWSIELDVDADDAYIAWTPMFHMAATDPSLATFMLGGKVIIADGLDFDVICSALEADNIGWLCSAPGMSGLLLDELTRRNPKVRGVKCVGSPPDLVPLSDVAAITGLLNADWCNGLGSTENGFAPLYGRSGFLSAGALPQRLAKAETVFCDMRLVDEDDNDVPDTTPGEVLVRCATLFSGYWNAPAVNESAFRGGWFHTGDIGVRHPDGRVDFVDRLKYLIKSGGENIYPAEIERILLEHPSVRHAVAVRGKHERWGETPIVYVVAEPAVDVAELTALFEGRLAKYKRPTAIRFIEAHQIPRNFSGKVLRQEMEAWQ